MTEYLRMSGIYWGITVMDLMKHLDSMAQQEIVDFVFSCQHECGGFGASVSHDPHLLYTLSALQASTLPCTFHWMQDHLFSDPKILTNQQASAVVSSAG